MAKITMEHQDEILTFPPDSILELKVQEVIIESYPSQRGGEFEKARFKFKILGIQAIGGVGTDVSPRPYESWIGRDIWGSVPWRLTDNAENRLRIWAEAIFKQELGPGFELDSDMFLQRNVRGLTSQYEAKARDSSGMPFKRHQIETLLPWSDQPVARPQTVQQTAQQWAQPVQQQAQQQQAQPVGNGAQSSQQQDPWALPTGLQDPPF